MFKLILFELKKLCCKMSFKIILISIILVTLFSCIIISKRDYEDNLVYYDNVDVLIDKNNYSKKDVNKLEKEIEENNKIYDYSLMHEKDYFNKSKQTVKFSYTLLMFLLIVIVIMASQIVTNEFQDKTIKLLFTMPYKRWKILFSKFISMVLVTLFFSLVLSILMIIFTMIFIGAEGLFINDLVIINGKVCEVSFFVNYFKTYLIFLIPVLFVMLISFSLSTIYLNTALAVSISLALAVGGMTVFSFMVPFISFLEYSFLPYLDFTIFNNKINILLFNIENNINLSVKKGVVILCFYATLFYLFAVRCFKKDVRC